jgi:uncharacterized membrane protein YcaP (DUF421 family)
VLYSNEGNRAKMNVSSLMQIAERALGVGMEAQRLEIRQVLLRAIIVFVSALVMVRVGDKRFFAKKTAFDVILGFILASMLARAINGSEQLGPTIAAGFELTLLHRALAWLGCRWPTFSGWIKGHSQKLVEAGRIDRGRLRKHHMGEDDLLEELRLNGVESPQGVALACLEPSGEVSVIKRE